MYVYLNKLIHVLLSPAYWILARILINEKITLEEEGRQCIIIANHIHFVDPFLIASHFSFDEKLKTLPIRIITANKYLTGLPGLLPRALGCFPAKPLGNQHSGLEAARMYSKNYTIMMFPEGARSTTNKIPRLRTGAAVLAKESSLPVLPIYISKDGRRFRVVRGEYFYSNQGDIEFMMQKVWDLEKHLKA